MNYLMAPLHIHADSGFGAVGSAFHRAALSLAADPQPGLFFEDLPINFLFRHAIELFLKSGIVIVHRTLKIPYGPQPYFAAPAVPQGTKWNALTNEHDVGRLYDRWKLLINENELRLKARMRHSDDLRVDVSYDSMITLIEEKDKSSTYSRYPSMRNRAEDTAKSPFKQIPLEGLFSETFPEKKKMSMVVEDDAGNFMTAYQLDEETDAALRNALKAVAEMLANFHVMARMEWTQGW